MAFLGNLWPYQVEAAERMVDRGQMLLGMVMGAGKEQPVSSLVATCSGFRRIGDLLPGDTIITPDGGHSPVLGVYPQGIKDVYEVVFSDGSTARCGLDHLWRVQRVQGRTPKWQTLSLRELMEGGLTDSWGNHKWRIPMTEPVQWFGRSTPALDAYTLGLLLGDGSFRTGTPTFSSADQELVDSLVLPEGVVVRRKSVYDWRLSREATSGPNPLTKIIRQLGLWSLGSRDKFVPHSYLHGSVEDRLALLQGVMDTDGTPTRGAGGELVTTSLRLAEDVAWLTESLGGSARWGKHKHGYRVLVKLPQGMSPFRLTRKAGGSYTKYPVTRLVAGVRLVGQEECVCIRVSGGLYLTDHFVVTHNTPTALGAIEELFEDDEVDRCLVVVPASLKFQWLREIHKFTDAKATVIDGSKAQRAAQWKLSANSRYVIVNPETLINDVKQVGTIQAMIIDEATIIKNRGAKRSRLLKRIGKTVPYRFALTGQPIENRPEELFSIMEFVDKEVLGPFDVFDRTFIVRDHFGKPLRYRNLDKMFKVMQECMVRKTREDIADQLPDIIHQVIPVPFDSKAAALYKYIAKDLLTQIGQAVKSGGGSFNLWSHYNDPAGKEAQGQIMARLTVLRMLCDNPELVRISANQYQDDSVAAGSQYASDLLKKGLLDGISESPKLDAVIDYIREVLEEDPKNKVVLFSFFKKNLTLIQEATKHLADSVLFMGGMTAEERDTAKQKFANDPKCRLFLSSDAGGYGVDLPMANYLISYDLPWSSGKLEQREARIIRLSSEFPHVTIATFVMQGSIEERQYEMLQHKRSVNEAFIDGKHQDKEHGMQITLDTLSNFLRESIV